MAEPTNYQKIIQTLATSLHLRWTDETDAAQGIPEPEHRRRHYLWVCGVLSGLALAMDHPMLAMRVAKTVRDNKDSEEFGLAFIADFLARQLSDEVWPLKADETKLRILADEVTAGAQNTGVIAEKLTFEDDGTMHWEPKEPGEFAIPTWRETFDEWDDV